VVDVETAAAFALRAAGDVQPGSVPWAEVTFISSEAIRAIKEGRLVAVGKVGELDTVERNAFLEWAICKAAWLRLNPVQLQRLVSPPPGPLEILEEISGPVANESGSVKEVWSKIWSWPHYFS